MDDARTEQRMAAANRLDQCARWSALLVLPLIVVAAVDLGSSGWLTGDRRFDVVLLLCGAGAFWGAYQMRKQAQRFRLGDVRPRPTAGRWVRAGLSLAATLAFAAVLGYLVAGPVFAVLLPLLALAVMASSIARRWKRNSGGSGST